MGVEISTPAASRQHRVGAGVVRVDRDCALCRVRGPGLDENREDQRDGAEHQQGNGHEAPSPVDVASLRLSGLAQLDEVRLLACDRPLAGGAVLLVVRRGPGASRRSPTMLGPLCVTPSHTGRGLYRGACVSCKLARRLVRGWYISYRRDPDRRPGVSQKTGRLDIPAVHRARRGLLTAGVLCAPGQRRAADLPGRRCPGLLLNPVVRRLEALRVPRALAVIGVFLVLILVAVVTLLSDHHPRGRAGTDRGP